MFAHSGQELVSHRHSIYVTTMKNNDPLDDRLSDALVFEVAKRWLQATGEEQKKLTTGVAEWLVDRHARELPWIDLRWARKRQIDLTRYRIYKIVRQAIDRKFVQLHAPRAVDLAEKLEIGRAHVLT